MVIQKPAQRRANERFAKSEEKRKGKAHSVRNGMDYTKKSAVRQGPKISKGWLIFIGILIFGTTFFQILSIFFW